MFILALFAGDQTFRFPPLSKCELSLSLKVRADGVPWSVDCYRYDKADIKHYEAEGFAVIRKNGKEIARWAPLQRPFCSAYQVDIKPGYPVVAVRGAWGIGSHWDTMLFAIRKGKLVKMGRPPAMNSNGPILWRGQKDIWAFDNFDRYEDMHNEKFRLARVLMKVDPNGRLRKWKTTVTPHPRVRTTIRTPDDLDIPKGGL